MKSHHSERGQALIMIVFAAVALFAFTALAIDGSRVFSDRRHAQNAVDTAALAAALAQVRGNDYVTAAEQRAASNGFNATMVEVNLCSTAGLNPPCEALPVGADNSQYIQVVIRLSTPTTFARILGWQEVPSVVSAIARATGGASPVSFQSPAISAMHPTDPKAVWGHGNFNLLVHNSGIFVNSRDDCGFETGGSAGQYHVDTSYDVVGGYCRSGNPTLSGTLNPDATQIPYPPAIDIPAPSITCDPTIVAPQYANGQIIIPPGTHNSMNLSGFLTFQPGNHCFPNGFRIIGNSFVTINDANFLISGGSFDMSANGTFTCNNLLVHINGGTGMHFNGRANANCTGTTFYASTGDVRWNGDITNVFTAPTSGTYKGLLLYMPYGNSNSLTVSGNSSSSFTGSIIAISSDITLYGNGQTLALSTKIIGYRVRFGGNGNLEINYDPSQQYAQGEPTMIQVIK